MIFYFTGTGNSLFAAKRLLNEGEELINIADAMNETGASRTPAKGEAVGLVFPVYFYTVPKIIEEFIDGLELKGAEYIYAVITCGGGISQAGAVLNKLLKKKGLKLDYVSSLLMPDNSMLFYQIPPVEESGERLKNAELRLAGIKAAVDRRETVSAGSMTVISDLVGLGYGLSNKTAKFYADENCIGCGLCERSCPQKVIRLTDGRPVWTKDRCAKCSACINRCPKSAIQYGKGTRKRNRYVNPEYQS